MSWERSLKYNRHLRGYQYRWVNEWRMGEELGVLELLKLW